MEDMKSEVKEETPVQTLATRTQQDTLPAPTSLTPAEMLSLAVQQGADTQKLEKLMDLQERWERNEARKAFEQAMVNFSAKVIAIQKTRTVDFGEGSKKTFYKYAGLAETVEQIQSLMAECQLSRRWQDEEPVKAGNIRIRCVVSHVRGHSESFAVEAPPDTSGCKNAAQSVASIITYLRRTSLYAVLGLVACDEVEDDGQGAAQVQQEPKRKAQVRNLKDVAEHEEEKNKTADLNTAKRKFAAVCCKKADVHALPPAVLTKLLAEVQGFCGGDQDIDACSKWLEKHGSLVKVENNWSVAENTESGG